MDEFKFQPDPVIDYRVTCSWASEKSMYNVVNILAPPFLIGSSSFLQVTRTTIKSQMSYKFCQIHLWTAELAAHNQLKTSFTYLRTVQNILMTCWLSGERSLSIGLLVVDCHLLLLLLFLLLFIIIIIIIIIISIIIIIAIETSVD